MGARRLRIGSLITTVALSASVIAAIGAPAARAADNPCANGCWSKPFSPFGMFDAAPPATISDSKLFPAASSAVMMPSGRILYWNGLQDLEGASYPLPADAGRVNPHSKTSILDLTGSSAQFYPDANAPVGDDLFCSDQRLNQNGDVVVAGGTHWTSEVANPLDDGTGPGGLSELYGSHQTHLFTAGDETLVQGLSKDNPTADVTNSKWSLGAEMAKGRWYPSQVTLADGREFVAGGVGKLLWNSQTLDQVDSDKGGDTDEATNPAPQNVLETEIYNADNNTWALNDAAANVTLPLFARLHLLPNGEIYFGGVGQMWGPAGQSVDQTEWNNIKLLDSHNIAGGWRTDGMATYGARSGAFSVLMPLKPDASGNVDDAHILVGGGVLGTSPGTEIATAISEMIDLTKDDAGKFQATATQTPDMNNRRWYSSAVLLPNGQVVAVNGADKDEVVMPGTENAIRAAELWDGEQWVPLSDGSRDRTYHNSAMLLPDGSVLVGGHAPINQAYGPNGTTASPLNANNFKDPSFERLFPPYLYADGGARPSILSSQKYATWGQDLEIQADPNTADPIDHFVLSRLPSVTHTTDADARQVVLPGFTTTGTTIKAPIPNNQDLLPPGFYYLFAVSANGVPSVATAVEISDGTAAHKAGGDGNATPIQIADTPLVGTAGASAIHGVSAPKAAAKHDTASTKVTAPVADVAAERTVAATAKDAAGTKPLGVLAGFAALAGVALVRRRKLVAARS